MAKQIERNASEPRLTCSRWLDRASIELHQAKHHLYKLQAVAMATEPPSKSSLEHRPARQTRPASTTLMLPLRRNRIFVASSLKLLVRRNCDPQHWFPVYTLQWKIDSMSALVNCNGVCI